MDVQARDGDQSSSFLPLKSFFFRFKEDQDNNKHACTLLPIFSALKPHPSSSYTFSLSWMSEKKEKHLFVCNQIYLRLTIPPDPLKARFPLPGEVSHPKHRITPTVTDLHLQDPLLQPNTALSAMRKGCSAFQTNCAEHNPSSPTTPSSSSAAAPNAPRSFSDPTVPSSTCHTRIDPSSSPQASMLHRSQSHQSPSS